MKKTILLVAIFVATLVACGNAHTQITLTLQPKESEEGKVEIFLRGTGTAKIDWGDGSPIQTHELMVLNRKIDGFWIRYWQYHPLFSHTYANKNDTYTITVIGENITLLICSDIGLIHLDVTDNPALIYLDCSNNQLTNLNVRRNTSMTHLNCSNNQLTNLDVNYNSLLLELNCENNQLKSLDLSYNTELRTLHPEYNQLSAAALNSLLETLNSNEADDGKFIYIRRSSIGDSETDISISEQKRWNSWVIEDLE